MQRPGNSLVLLICFFSLACASQLMAQNEATSHTTKFIIENGDPTGHSFHSRHPDKDIVLRMGTQITETDLDCSHFVQWLFERAGLYYGYVPSRVLYDGMAGFQRVFRPEPGDLIVWPGHMGIVVDPEEETFLSALRSGVKTASYTSRYWKLRGDPHFFRYLPGAEPAENDWQPVVAGRRTGRTTPASE